MGLLTAYVRTLSDGMKMNIRVDSPAARVAFEDGKRSDYTRVGQLNFACASSQVQQAGSRLRSDRLAPAIGQRPGPYSAAAMSCTPCQCLTQPATIRHGMSVCRSVVRTSTISSIAIATSATDS